MGDSSSKNSIEGAVYVTSDQVSYYYMQGML